MPFNPRRAQEKGIDVQHVVTSWRSHLLADRDKLRANPKLVERPDAKLNIAVKQTANASGIHWTSLGGLPEGMGELTASASTFDAARQGQGMTAPKLVEQRFRKRLAEALMTSGKYRGTDLEVRRAAIRRAVDASISVADFDLAGTT